MNTVEELKHEIDTVGQQSMDLMARHQLKEAWEMVEFRYQAIKSALGEVPLSQDQAKELIEYIRLNNAKLQMMSQKVNQELGAQQQQLNAQNKVNNSYKAM